MATNMIADTITSTSNELDDESLYEIVDGERIDVPMSVYASMVAKRIIVKIESSDAPNYGEAAIETLFRFDAINRSRRPDVAFVKFDRWPKGNLQHLKENAWKVVPNLAVEVISPSEFAEEVLEKIAEYFQIGVESVWVVYPRLGIFHRYASLTDITAFGRDDTLTDEKVLPGFKLPLSEIFLKEE